MICSARGAVRPATVALLKRSALPALMSVIANILVAMSSAAESGNSQRQDPNDPFVGVTPAAADIAETSDSSSVRDGFFQDNFTFKKEIYSQFSYGPKAHHASTGDRWYSRQSIGFEALKKLSTKISTVASFDFQGRLVRRDQFIPILNDQEGANREGWFAEYHNAYLDLYNILNPLLTEEQRGAATGHFNFRLGRFYLPFGINLQTDTHGTLLQLSNERNFGFERDWYAGFWGSISPELNYDLYYLLGSGYDPSFKGQDGMIGSRISLSNVYLNEYGIEGGISVLAGQRRSKHALERSPGVAGDATDGEFIQTKRFGLDARYTHLISTGSLAGTGELSAGRDESENVLTQLYQLDYLNRSRKWGISSQYRRFHQDLDSDGASGRNKADSSLIGELTWFFRNDIGNSNLHWLKLNLERQLERIEGRNGTVTTVQYYRYW